MRYLLNRPDIENPWLFDRCREVQAAPDGFLDLWSREFYKSTVITFGKTIQDILATHGDDAQGQEITVGIFSHTRPAAKGFLKQIKRELETNAVLKELFPDILYQDPRNAQKWSEDDGIIVKRKTNPKEATIEAWGVVDGQPIGKHFDLLVYDDIVTANSVATVDMVAKTTEMLVLSYALGAATGKRRFIGTRYSLHDTYKEIIERGSVTPRLYAGTQDGTFDGEPTFRPKEWLQEKLRDMGSYVYSCQILQNPISRTGGMFDPTKFKIVDYAPEVEARIRAWDKAGSEDSGAYTAGVLMGRTTDGQFIILDVQRGQHSALQRERLIRQTAEVDGNDVHIWLEQEPGSGGLESAEASIRNLAGFAAHKERVTGDKVTRAEPYATMVEAGQVLLLKAEWNRAFLDEHLAFPGKYKDQVDAAACAFNKLAKPNLPRIRSF